MSDELLRYYNSELEYLRRVGAEFARAHPRTAGYLNFGEDEDYDPHVGRLVQAFAYLNARTRKKLDDDFPELSESLLDILYPHYLRPVPSAAILQFGLEPAQAELTTGYAVPRGTGLESEPINGQPCRFRTCYDVTCWPLQVAAARYEGVPFTAPPSTFSGKAQAVLSLRLQTFARDLSLHKLRIPKLRFYLRSQTYYAHLLYELLMNHLVGVAVSPKPEGEAVMLDSAHVTPVGFVENEGLFDYPARSFLGYRLLSEYFSFPDKFLFFDVHVPRWPVGNENAQTIYFYLNRHLNELQPHVAADTFALGCTPIVNLYRHRAEPIRVTHFHTEYPLIPDTRRPFGHEVFSIDRVVGTTPARKELHFQPFYSILHETSPGEAQRFWHARRHWNAGDDPARQGGDEVSLALVDLNFNPAAPAELTIDVETTCLNRNLPSFLPFGGDRPRFNFETGSAIRRVSCLTKPTATLRPNLGQATRWQLVSHLALGHLSLSGPRGLDTLREMLRLYNAKESPETEKMIAGLVGLESRPVVSRVHAGGSSVVCRGLEVAVTFDEEQYREGGMYLLASVLDHFFALYTNLNSFTQLVARSTRREGIWKRWPAKTGELPTL